MPTDTKLNQLIINQLTQEQYDEAKAAGTLSDTELYITDSDDDALTNNKITNCITEIPQDIKLELNNNNTIVLKKGSIVYIPNGTRNNKVTITKDFSDSADSNRETMLFYKVGHEVLEAMPVEFCFSGSTAPTSFLSGNYAVWYDTKNNVIKLTKNGGTNWDSGYSFPICLAHETTTTYSISQVFNGFGYIGSTVYALPGVKGLIPNGRNADGSLKSIEFNLNEVRTFTDPYLVDGELVFGINALKNINNAFYSDYNYNEKENFNLYHNTVWDFCFFAKYTAENDGKITSFTPKTVFHALDYNDKSTISGWSMPSSRYIDLTLAVSGSTYTAPANGWYSFRANPTGPDSFIEMINNSCPDFGSTASSFTTIMRCLIPVKKGDTLMFSYNSIHMIDNVFRFFYAEGENS